MKNEETIKAFFKDNHVRFSAETTRTYKISLDHFFSYCTKEYVEVKPKDIRAWLASMEENGLKPNTIRAKLAALKSFYQYCLEENLLVKVPTATVETPKKDDSLPRYLNKLQLALLQEAAKDNPRDRAIIETLYATGVRISELLSIKVKDVKWETKQIWVTGKGNKDRFVLFTHECAERLKTYLNDRKDDSPYLFSNGRGGSLSRSAVELWFQDYSEALGFKVIPHIMRHTFAAHLTEKGMPQSYVQDLLGHANINSTKFYTRLMEDARKKQYDRFQ